MGGLLKLGEEISGMKKKAEFSLIKDLVID